MRAVLTPAVEVPDVVAFRSCAQANRREIVKGVCGHLPPHPPFACSSRTAFSDAGRHEGYRIPRYLRCWRCGISAKGCSCGWSSGQIDSLKHGVDVHRASQSRSVVYSEPPELGKGGMADTRDPEPFTNDSDPRQSISEAPSFEE